MRSVNLKPYDIVVGKTKDGAEIKQPFNVVKNIIDVLFAPAQQLAGRDLLKQGALADQIESAEAEGEVLLEEEEWNRLKIAVEVIKGYTRDHIEFMKRIVDAPKADIKTTK